MPSDSFSRKKKIGALAALGLFILLFASFSPNEQPTTGNKQPTTNCNPDAKPFYGYTFLYPDLINKSGAYAPFFLRWDDYYEQIYFDKYRDIQREENVKEWIGRFCGQPEYGDVETVVYSTDAQDLVQLQYAAEDKEKKTPLPYLLTGNTFAEMIALNGCTEVIDYLRYAKRCEPHVTTMTDNTWTLPPRDTRMMYDLINEGMERFEQTKSYFIKLRYAYQMIRLAHYLGNWNYTLELHDRLIPRLDLKKSSIVYYWIIGHVAGAMQKLGKYPEAAYRYSLVFRHCPSKRIQALRSFQIRNDVQWQQTLLLCQSDAEKATLYVMRAADARERAVEEMREIYKLEPGNPQLDLLLVSMVQELEKIILRTSVTDKKRGYPIGELKRQNADKHLLDLQKFVREVVQEKKIPNQKLWRATEGYLALLAGDRNAAHQDWKGVEKKLDKKADKNLAHQIGIWRCLLDVMNLDTITSGKADSMSYVVRGNSYFRENPYFESFLQDWLSAKYADKHPGKAILVAWSPAALAYNPNLALLDDLLKLADSNDPILLKKTMLTDTNPDYVKTRLLEIRGAYLLSLGQPEAALATLRKIKPTQEISLNKFAPFREKVGEQVHRPPVYDTLILNRREIAEKIIAFEFQAKLNEAENNPDAAWYYYLIGLGYYNMSYFGFEWEVTDFYRSGYNQMRLAQGPVFTLRNSPNGNRENTDVSLPLSYFERAFNIVKDKTGVKEREMAARAAFMAARCRQKQWFCDPECTYRPGSKLIPTLPDHYMDYYNLLATKYSDTKFYTGVVKECKWLEAYSR